jgi:hypothetical protein
LFLFCFTVWLRILSGCSKCDYFCDNYWPFLKFKFSCFCVLIVTKLSHNNCDHVQQCIMSQILLCYITFAETMDCVYLFLNLVEIFILSVNICFQIYIFKLCSEFVQISHWLYLQCIYIDSAVIYATLHHGTTHVQSAHAQIKLKMNPSQTVLEHENTCRGLFLDRWHRGVFKWKMSCDLLTSL